MISRNDGVQRVLLSEGTMDVVEILQGGLSLHLKIHSKQKGSY